MSSAAAAPPARRNSTASRRAKKPSSIENGVAPSPANANGTSSKPSSPDLQPSSTGERTVRKLRLSKALTISEATMVSDACRRMAHRKVDAVLLTDSNGLLSGIVTDKDIAMRVIAEGLRPDHTVISKVMTRNPMFVTSDTLAIEAMQKMVQGKFRHLPVVENGEVMAILDITKCLYDAISRMEKAAEQGSAIAAAVEGVERQWGNNFSAQYSFIESLRERMFKPSLSSIISDSTKVVVVLPSDPVYLATRKMRDSRVNSVIVVNAGKPQGILTSRDILMRVVAHSLPPELTFVEKVMTASPQCATVDTTILDALHILHDGKFLHLPVVDHDGSAVACLDVLQLTHAAVSMVDSGPGGVNDMASAMMQKFWDSALALDLPDDDLETRSEVSALMTSEGAETAKSLYPPLGLANSFAFKFQDQNGCMHRISCGAESLVELLTAVTERAGAGIGQDDIQLLYEDDEGDRILLLRDSDLIGAVNYARISGLKVLRLHIEIPNKARDTIDSSPQSTAIQQSGFTPLHAGILAGAILLTSIGVMVYLKRSSL